MLALLAAMKSEIAGVQKRMVIEKTVSDGDCYLLKGKYKEKPVLLARSGMGRERAEKAARLILEKYPVTTLVSLGFGGALTAKPEAGDIILCSTLHYSGNPGRQASPCKSSVNLLSMCAKAMDGEDASLRQGKSVTVDNPVITREEKLALGKSSHADVADMESYWIARIASERQVPFLAVRAISDTLNDRLPPFEIMTMDGGVRWDMAAVYALAHPQAVKMFGLYRKARRAEKSLTAFVDYLVAKL